MNQQGGGREQRRDQFGGRERGGQGQPEQGPWQGQWDQGSWQWAGQSARGQDGGDQGRGGPYGTGPGQGYGGGGYGYSTGGYGTGSYGSASSQQGYGGEGFSNRGNESQWGTESGWGEAGHVGSSGGQSGSNYGGGGFGSGNYQGGFQGQQQEPGRRQWRAPLGYQRSDQRIYEDLCDRLAEHPYVDPRNVRVKVENCVVTLEDTVWTRQEKHLAEDLADSIPGVKDVVNQIRVGRKEQADQRDKEEIIGLPEGSHMISRENEGENAVDQTRHPS